MMMKNAVKTVRRMVGVAATTIALATLTAGCDGPRVEWHWDASAAPKPSAVDDAFVWNLKIIGQGSVEVEPITEGVRPCIAERGNPTTDCGAYTFHGGGAVRAVPSQGWLFDKWVASNPIDENTITNPKDPYQVLVPGMYTPLHAHFVRAPTRDTLPRTTLRPPAKGQPSFSVTPVDATYMPGDGELTQYHVDVFNPLDEPLTLIWGGPKCGEWDPQGPITSTSVKGSTMSWYHPSPPCDADLSKVRVSVTVVGPDGVIVCWYNGTATGTGPVCNRGEPEGD